MLTPSACVQLGSVQKLGCERRCNKLWIHMQLFHGGDLCVCRRGNMGIMGYLQRRQKLHLRLHFLVAHGELLRVTAATGNAHILVYQSHMLVEVFLEDSGVVTLLAGVPLPTMDAHVLVQVVSYCGGKVTTCAVNVFHTIVAPHVLTQIC